MESLHRFNAFRGEVWNDITLTRVECLSDFEDLDLASIESFYEENPELEPIRNVQKVMEMSIESDDQERS